jgi:tetratricopeptide (TPR) repeat protein
MFFFRLLTCVLVITFLKPALAREHQHENHAPADSIPLEILQRPVTLRSGIGAMHEAVTTSSKEAQAFYDQGLAYLHSYVWIEAARSFNQALRLDPKLAMAFVGLSRAFSGLNAMEAARAALDQAQALQTTTSASERQRISIRAKQLEAMRDPGNAAKHFDYKKAIDDAIAAGGNNVELLLLRGNAEEANASGRGQHGGAASITFYLRALAAQPDNFAAHHYLTHSYENTGRIEEALKHGERYARLAPAIPHARHMYGHDLRRVGRVSDAIAEFRKADELENAYYKSENIPAQYDWHHEHNLDLLSTSYQHEGQMNAAEQLMRQAFAIPSMQDALEFNKRQWPEFLLARGRTDEALEAANTLAKSRWDIVRSIGRVMASRALMAGGKLPAASDEAKAALNELRDSGRRADFVRPYIEALQGEFFLRTGQAEKGRAVLKEMMRKVRAELGPDAWTQSLFKLEAIARVAREAGDWELAEYAAQQMMEHDPNYAGAHYAMALAAEHKGDKAGALEMFAAAEKFWRNADADLPELLETRARITQLRK